MAEHLCKKCYEINKDFVIVKNNQKICGECGGVVLDVQEAADYIAELHSELRYYKGEDIE